MFFQKNTRAVKPKTLTNVVMSVSRVIKNPHFLNFFY